MNLDSLIYFGINVTYPLPIQPASSHVDSHESFMYIACSFQVETKFDM